MEFIHKAKAIRLRSHIDKYLQAEEDQKTIRQSRNGSSRKVRWTVEIVEGSSHLIRLKSCYGQYLSASEETFLLGMTGKKVLQTTPSTTKFVQSSLIEWEPIRDGFQVKLRTRSGTFLRANGATLPWRNSITHDTPHMSTTHDWLLWDIDMVDSPEVDEFKDFQSQLSSISSTLSEDYMDSPISPWSLASIKLPRLLSSQLGMEYFQNAKSVRLKSHHEKYLLAEEDEESVTQDRNGSSKTARWIVEFVKDGSFIRLKSCFGKYLTASNSPFLLGMTGRKVLQTLPRRLDSSIEWEPIKDGSHVKLKTRYGNFLRANGGLPPWRNSITHDIPHRTATQDWVLWDIDVLEFQVHVDSPKPELQDSESVLLSEPSSPSNGSFKSEKSEKFESSGSFAISMPQKAVEGRIIYFSIADDNGNVDDAVEGGSFSFKGNGVNELTHKLEEETGLDDIIVCTRSPLNGKLYPLRLQLPPNHTTMHVVVVDSSSRDMSNSRLRDPVIKHGTPFNGDLKTSQCYYCGTDNKSGGATRLKEHLSGVDSKDTTPCDKVPEWVIRELRGYPKHPRTPKKNPDVIIRDTPLQQPQPQEEEEDEDLEETIFQSQLAAAIQASKDDPDYNTVLLA